MPGVIETCEARCVGARVYLDATSHRTATRALAISECRCLPHQQQNICGLLCVCMNLTLARMPCIGTLFSLCQNDITVLTRKVQRVVWYYTRDFSTIFPMS